MKIKSVSGIVLTLLLMDMLTLAFDVQPVNASGTIHIRADGSVDPPTAGIMSADNFTYTLTSNIYEGINVERDNIVVDGAGYFVQGYVVPEVGPYPFGIQLSGRSNITIKNMEIKAFGCGIYLSDSTNNNIFRNKITKNNNGVQFFGSSNNNIHENNITDTKLGIRFFHSSNNDIYRNNIANNKQTGVGLSSSSNNGIRENDITNSCWAIFLDGSSNNSISGNNLVSNDEGIYLERGSSDNCIHGNNVAENNIFGICVASSPKNSIHENNITNNGYDRYSIEGHRLDGYGLWLSYSSDNTICHNNLVNNALQVDSDGSVNTWDDGYPSGGNYWSDYNGTDADGDGIGNTPYTIDENNQDNNPLMEPWNPSWSARVPVWTQWWFWRIVIAAIAASAVAVYFWKKRKKPTSTVS